MRQPKPQPDPIRYVGESQHPDHPHAPLVPRWFWPVVIVCVVWIAVLALLSPATTLTTGHVQHDGHDH